MCLIIWLTRLAVFICAGRPPLSHATAETAVATLKESRFKVELQKGLEECKAELVDARRPAKADNQAPVQASRTELATFDQPGKTNSGGSTAFRADPADTSQAVTDSPSAAKETHKAEQTGTGQAAKGNGKAQAEAFTADLGNSGRAALAAPKAAQEISLTEPADGGQAVAAAPQPAATRPRPQAVEVPEGLPSDQPSSRSRPPLQSPSAAGKKSPSAGAQLNRILVTCERGPHQVPKFVLAKLLSRLPTMVKLSTVIRWHIPR